MKQIQTLFGEIKEIKETSKELIQAYKEKLKDDIDYQCLKNEVAEKREKMKRIENIIASEFDLDMESIRKEIAANKEMMSDIAISELMEKGKIESVVDGDFTYEPEIKVRFKAIKEKVEFKNNKLSKK